MMNSSITDFRKGHQLYFDEESSSPHCDIAVAHCCRQRRLDVDVRAG